jgi:hypothetical protein
MPEKKKKKRTRSAGLLQVAITVCFRDPGFRDAGAAMATGSRRSARIGAAVPAGKRQGQKQLQRRNAHWIAASVTVRQKQAVCIL